MYYKELLRVLRALKNMAIVYVVIDLVYAAFLIFANAQGHLQLPKPSDHVSLSLGALFAICAFAALFPATAYGCSLAAENDGHLALAWTKPASRVRYALTVMSVDAAGIVAAFALTFVLLLLPELGMVGVLRYLSAGPSVVLEAIRHLAVPLAWFALCQALTASLRCNARMVAGVSVLPAIVLAMLAGAPLPGAWHQAFHALGYINPLAYWAGFEVNGSGASANDLMTFALPVGDATLVALVLIYAALAIVQWRRLEA